MTLKPRRVTAPSLASITLLIVVTSSAAAHPSMQWQDLFAFSTHYGEPVNDFNRHFDYAGEGVSIDSTDLLALLGHATGPELTPVPSGMPASTPTRTPTWDTGPNYTCTPDDTWTPFPSPSTTATLTPRPDIGADPVLVYVPAGIFSMGSTQTFPTPAGADEAPVHRVRLDAFYIGKYEVTQQQYQPFIDAGGYTQDSYWSALGRFARDSGFTAYNSQTRLELNSIPVIVSWVEAEAFCNWGGWRLPTEAEWEKAAGWDPLLQHARSYPWGDLWDRQACHGYFDCWSSQALVSVGVYPQGRSFYGCEDMIGNIGEWVADLYSPTFYAQGPGGADPGPGDVWDNPRNDVPGSPREHVAKGGSWNTVVDLVHRVQRRDHAAYYSPAYGFRVARDAFSSPPPQPSPTSSSTSTPTRTPPLPVLPTATARPVASFNIPMVLVAAGRFPMGSVNEGPVLDETDEYPSHSVYLDDYYIGVYEITNAQFRPFVEDGGYRRKELWTAQGWALLCMGSIPSGELRSWEGDDEPASGVTFHEAEAWCRWAGYRLPTEAEWEKAAGWDSSNQTMRRYPWGNDLNTDLFNNPFDSLTGLDFGRYTSAGSYPGGVSPYGCHDMMGNVMEWVSDWYDPDYYKRGPGGVAPGGTVWNNPFNNRHTNQPFTAHVLRGGQIVTAASEFRVSARWIGYGGSRDHTGFRVAADPRPTRTPTPFPTPDFAMDEFVTIPAGPFRMGDSTVNYASPPHWVMLDAYQIGKYEVTVGEYRRFIEDYGYFKREYWSDAGWQWRTEGVSPPAIAPHFWFACDPSDYWEGPFPLPDDHPVIGVSWYEAEAYCNWIGGRLPTEAEWEKAAGWVEDNGVDRNTLYTYPWGNVLNVNWANGAYDSLFPGIQTSPVGTYATDRSPYGCYDVAGNMWEWCSDWFSKDYYSEGPAGCYAEKLEDVTEFWVNPKGPSVNVNPLPNRTMRGGSFDIYPGAELAYRIATRGDEGFVIFRPRQFGFRAAKDVE